MAHIDNLCDYPIAKTKWCCAVFVLGGYGYRIVLVACHGNMTLIWFSGQGEEVIREIIGWQ